MKRTQPFDIERETLHSRYGSLYALGKVLILLAQLPEAQRKILLRRAWVFAGESAGQLEKIG